MKTINHFDSVSKGYNENRSKGWLGNIVNKEKEVILKFLDIKKNEKILDVGCGSGFYSKIIKNLRAKPYGIDLSKNMINLLKKNGINGEVADIENFNLRKKFDKILCVGVFEFLKNPENAVKCIKKHLKKNGYFVLLYPRVSIGGILYFFYHLILHRIKIKLFSKKSLNKLFSKYNFRLINLKKPEFITAVAKFKSN